MFKSAKVGVPFCSHFVKGGPALKISTLPDKGGNAALESECGGRKDRHAQEISLSAQNATLSLLLSHAGNFDIINASILRICVAVGAPSHLEVCVVISGGTTGLILQASP